MAIISRGQTLIGGRKLRTYSDRGIIISALIFLVLSVADAFLTLWGLKLDIIREANPVMKMLIDSYPALFFLLKIIVPIILGLYCWWSRNKDRKLVTYALGIAVGVYIIVSGFHLYWIVLYNMHL